MGESEFMKQESRSWIKKYGITALTGGLLLVLSAVLLGQDVWTFWTWWLLALLMGLVAMPVTGRLFAGFADKGWLFSKVLAIGVTGFLTWFLVAVEIVPFTTITCVGVCAFCALLCFWVFRRQTKRGIEAFPVGEVPLVVKEEILFFAVFLLWTYLAGFHPQAYGTEKFMDYGFMEAMMRSTTLPARDLWYSEGTINYYYGGQYFAVFLTKLSGSRVELTYNLMRTFVAGLAFVLPFSLVYQMISDRFFGKLPAKKRWIPGVAGITAGMAVSLAGNMHYVVYRWILPLISRLQGVETTENYWFPDATRYIGFDPDVPDKTIHEFPCYSFVLGDLHAHVVNIMFVLLVLGILYAWMQWMWKNKSREEEEQKINWKRELLMPHILVVSVLLGMFQWTNFWDFVIYFVVAGGVVLFTNAVRFGMRPGRVLGVTLAQGAEVLAVSYAVILPFTLKFETMVQGVALAQNHSLPHQLLILWGLPVLVILLFFVSLFLERKKRVTRPDLFGVILGLCAMGLVLIPELVYVRDIYENGNARANTMFKLTYQAYIMFGIAMGYMIFRLLMVTKQKILKVLAGLCLFFLAWTVGYFGNCVSAWFGNVWDVSAYQGLDATTYLESDFSADAPAIRWLKENIEGAPVVLEANGDSYSGFERVSASTGLPTVLGWYVHEWLWRNDVADLNQKSADIETIYTSEDASLVQKLMKQYEVEYVFVGSKEREKYAERLNHETLQSLGEVVYADEASATYILCIQP
jgi:uncharacterized membrane protein